MNQPNLFDPALGAQLRDEGIARAGAAADPEWADAALDAVYALASTRREFTTDDVWQALDGANTRERRAMGAVMRRAQADGWIYPTDDYLASKRAVAHRGPKRIWRSRLYR